MFWKLGVDKYIIIWYNIGVLERDVTYKLNQIGYERRNMKREQKYPETQTFHYYNANPKNRITGDCRIRAISVACEVPYNQVVMDLAKIQCETGYDQTANQGISILMKKYGWTKCKQPRKPNGKKYTGKEFCRV